MPALNVNLTPELADFVSDEPGTGDYAFASELVDDALRALRRDREFERQKIETLRHTLDVGITQAERREFSARSVAEIAARVLAEDNE